MKGIFKQFLFCSSIFFCSASTLYSQDCRLTGVIVDQADNKKLPFAYVVATSVQDSTDKHFAASNYSGKFILGGLKRRLYRIEVSFISYHTTRQNVMIREVNTDLGNIYLLAEARKLEDVKIVANVPQAIQKGDTTEFNADAFKVNKDASTEDLVKKMPGVTIDNNGTVTAKGEQVQKVLVDGKPMFGDDPTIALRNLPAEIVDKIQVFDKLSDQSELTGFDDGNTTRTMNIITRTNRRNGQFGKLVLGYGDGDEYLASGTMNFFNGNRRISLLGLSDNINQQNFSMQDILGVMGQNQRSGGAMGGGGGGGGGRGGGGGGGGMSGSLSNFLIGQQNGISTTNSFGINYSDQWGSKIAVTASYFFNKSSNNTILNTSTQNFVGKDSSQFYNEKSGSSSVNFNNRFNMRFVYTIDSANTLMWVPSFSFQSNNTTKSLFGVTSLSEIQPLIQSDNNTSSNSSGENLSNQIVFRHKFLKKGRTISIALTTGVNTKSINSSLLSDNTYFTGIGGKDSTNQKIKTVNNGYNLASNLSYTEPVGTTGLLVATVNNSYTGSKSDKETYNLDYSTMLYTNLDTILTNKYNYGYQINRGGLAYRFKKNKVSFTVGMDYQNSNLDGSETFPSAFRIDRQFNNFLPNAMIRFNFSQNVNLQLIYRTSTTSPTITQLQSVIDNSNTLLLTTGNPDLLPQYTHTFITRYSFTNPEKSTNFFAFLTGGITQNNIGTSSIIPRKDTLLSGGEILRQGSTLSSPINLGMAKSLRSFFVFGFPIKPIKCNINVNDGFSWSQSPGDINNIVNLSNTYSLTQGIVMSSNISENVDFIGSYSVNYNIVNNSERPQLDDNYVIQTYSFKTNILILKGIAYETDFAGNKYTGLATKFNQNVFIWNMGLGYKFLKSKNAELRINAYNLFNKNNSVVRTVTQTSIQDQTANTLGRYFMLVFTFNLRNFAQGTPPPNMPNPVNFPFRRPDGNDNRFRPD